MNILGSATNNDFMPHGVCLLWNQWLLWLSATSDVLISLAYFSIPLALLYFAKKRKDFEYGRILVLFSAFIMLCGTTHLLGAIILWRPFYYVDVAAKIATAAVSVYTAVVIWPLIPALLAIPSPSQLERKNALLREEISTRKAAEERLKVALAQINMAVFNQDLDLRYTWMYNPQLGYASEEVIGKLDSELLPPSLVQQVTDLKRKVIAAGEGARTEVEGVLNGKRVYYDLAIEPLRDGEGNVVGITGASLDISKRKQAEEKLKAAKEDAEAANNQKDKFVSLVSHDLMSPLGGLIGFLKLMRTDSYDKLDDNFKRMLDVSISTAEDMVLRIKDILSISRLRIGAMKSQKRFFDASLIGKKIVDDYQYMAQSKGITLENAIPDHTSVYSDKTLLTEAVQNFVTNAIKFCGKGDRITISAEKGEKFTIYVSDTGPGMDPSIKQKLLNHESYQSTPGTEGEKGRGYGLMITKEVIKTLDGELLVETEQGKGSRFGGRVPHVYPRILLVDDEPFARIIIRQCLKRIDAEIIEAEDGVAAMELITKGKNLPHLIISDVEMPNMTGLELLSKLQKRPETESIPVIIVSGKHGMEIRDAVFQLGAKDYLSKALDVDDFIPRVRRFIS